MPISKPWIAYHQASSQATLRLFCFPYAGGCASIFRTWIGHLPSEVEVCPIQLPGRENRWKETPLTNLSELIQEILQSLPPYLDKPFAFFGHSMGA
ncbi:MAG TPA: thioesterase domain-containing protein, partial [Ktedonobacteraceae bacterium]|nr:thioesterase domain-containing protein [Ktedonobacteraceae bacterium]